MTETGRDEPMEDVDVAAETNAHDETESGI